METTALDNDNITYIQDEYYDFYNNTGANFSTTKACNDQGVYIYSYYAKLVVACLAIVFNILTIGAVHKAIRTLNSHYLLVVHQCLVDIVYALVNLLIFTYLTSWCVHAPNDECAMLSFFILGNSTFALVFFNLMAMSADNFVAVYRPMRYTHTVTKSRIYKAIGTMYVMWVTSLVAPFLASFTFDNTQAFCVQFPKNIMTLCYTMSTLIISLLGLYPMYGYIFYRALYRNDPQLSGTRKGNFRKSLTSLLILLTFTLFVHVDLTLLALQIYGIRPMDVQTIRQVTLILPSLNCICDPLIYAVRLPKVQKGYKELGRALKNVCHKQAIHGNIGPNSGMISLKNVPPRV